MTISRVWRLVACLVLATTATAWADEPTRIRVLCYNIRHGRGMDDKVDMERIAKVIRSANPDVVALQEVDKGVERSDRIDEPAELGRLSNMAPLFERNIPYQGGEYGNAILSRLPITGHRNVHLPSHYVGEQRGALVAELTAPNEAKTPFRFIATHIDYRPNDAERMDSVKAIEEAVRERPDVPTILAGDLNSRPDSRVIAAFAENWTRTDADVEAGSASLFTFPADKPDRQIDYVLVRPAERWRVVEIKVIDEPVASDHRPLLVVLELLD